MSSKEDVDRATFLRKVIVDVGHVAAEYFRDLGALTPESKVNAQDVVSRADRDVEEAFRKSLGETFPEDGVMGEEHGSHAGSSGYLWVIDPIDGTSPFLSALDHWCVSIAIQTQAGTIAGAVFDPNKGELFEAISGEGARLNGQALTIDPGRSLLNGLCGVGASHRISPRTVSCFIELLLAEDGMYYRNGSGALMLAQVAAGRLAAYYEPHMNAWDCLAGLLIVREAGGWTLDFPSRGTLAEGGVVAASGPGGAEHLRSLIDRANLLAKG